MWRRRSKVVARSVARSSASVMVWTLVAISSGRGPRRVWVSGAGAALAGAGRGGWVCGVGFRHGSSGVGDVTDERGFNRGGAGALAVCDASGCDASPGHQLMAGKPEAGS